MVRTSIRLGGIVVLIVGACLSPAMAQNATRPGSAAQKPAVTPAAQAPTPAAVPAVIQHAMDAKKYLFIFFYQVEDEETTALRKVFDNTMTKVADRAESVVARLADPSQKPLVNKFGADRAPMPMVLALAPNGAVTGGYPLKFDEQLLMSAFCSRSTWESLKALQDGKLVFFCIQNASTKFGAEALKAVQDVKADPQYTKLTEIVTIDPSDATETDALKRLSIEPNVDEAVTILLAPPATIITRFKGATTQAAIVAEIQKAAAGKGACCPGGKCGPGAPKPAPAPGTPTAATTGKPGTPAGTSATKPPPAKPQPPTAPGTKPQTGGTAPKP